MVARFADNIKHDVRMYVISLNLQLRAAAALRTAFVVQIVGMVLNNVGFVFAWFFLFQHFGTINGWGGLELIGFQGVNMVIFGLVMFVSVGLMDLPRHVDSGSFDNFLTKPSSVIGQVASSNIDVTTIGDFLLGVILTGAYIAIAGVNIPEFAAFLAALIIGCAIFWSFTLLLPNVLCFYMYNSETMGRYFGTLFLDSGLYPTGVVSGGLRTFLLWVFPGLFIGAVPLDILRGLHWELLAVGVIVSIIWLGFSVWVFKKSLRRYESANLVGAR